MNTKKLSIIKDFETTYNLLNIKDINNYCVTTYMDIDDYYYSKELLDYFYKINFIIDIDFGYDFKQIKNMLCDTDENIFKYISVNAPFKIRNDCAIFTILYVNKINKSHIKRYVNKYCMSIMNKITYIKSIMLVVDMYYKHSINEIIYIKLLLKKLTRKSTYFYIKIYDDCEYYNFDINKIYNIVKKYNNFFYITYFTEDLYKGSNIHAGYKNINMYAYKTNCEIIKKIMYNKLLYSFILNLVR